MESSEILLALIAAFLPISWGATWMRLNRIEDKLAQKVDRAEFREAMAVQHADIAQIRSDITQLALALGKGGPRAM